MSKPSTLWLLLLQEALCLLLPLLLAYLTGWPFFVDPVGKRLIRMLVTLFFVGFRYWQAKRRCAAKE